MRWPTRNNWTGDLANDHLRPEPAAHREQRSEAGQRDRLPLPAVAGRALRRPRVRRVQRREVAVLLRLQPQPAGGEAARAAPVLPRPQQADRVQVLERRRAQREAVRRDRRRPRQRRGQDGAGRPGKRPARRSDRRRAARRAADADAGPRAALRPRPRRARRHHRPDPGPRPARRGPRRRHDHRCAPRAR